MKIISTCDAGDKITSNEASLSRVLKYGVKNVDRIHSLDGLRAFAIVLVLLQHLYSSKTIPVLDYLWRFDLLGDIGVRVFFVISGFLITTLLRREYVKNGDINLRKFFFRRMLRIWPAYYALLLVVVAGGMLSTQQFEFRNIVGPVFFLTNYVGAPMSLGHTWSLAVEEQFYLLWPFLLVALGWRRAPLLVLLFCVLAPVLRGVASMSEITPPVLWARFENAGDAIGWGCLYALILERWTLPKLLPIKSAFCAIAAIGALLGMSMFSIWPFAWNIMGTVLANLLIVLLIHFALDADGTFVYWALNNFAARSIGLLSYSLYLWQQVFIYGDFKLGAPFNLMAITATATLSYFLIEKPFLRLKDHLGRLV